MSANLRLIILLITTVIIFIILKILQKGRLPIKYSLVWFLSTVVMLLVAIFPEFLIMVANLLGFKTMSNMVIGVMIIILLFISMVLTIIVSGQKEKIKLLVQEVSLLKKGVDDCENKK